MCETEGGGCTFRAALQEAGETAGTDTVVLEAGSQTTLTIPGQPNNSFPSIWVPAGVTIKSSGSGRATISGGCVCPLLGYDGGTGLIEDINFDGGYLAILVSGAELTVNRSRFANLNNNGSSSSAIHVNSSAGAGVIVNDSIIENNRASYYGVTMVSTGSITFNRSLIRNNTSTAYTTATISTYSFSNSSATIRIYNSTLQNNRSNAWGAVNSTIGTLDIRHSTFIDNDGAPAVRISPDVGPVNATIRGSIIRPGASGGSACEVGSGVCAPVR